MTNFVNERLRTFIALIVLIVGAFFIAKAMESKGVEVKVEKNTVLPAQWFEYTGPAFGTSGYDPLDQENYTPRGTTPPSCNTGSTVCAIHAEGEVISSPTPKVVPTNAELSTLSSDIQNNNPLPNRLQFKN